MYHVKASVLLQSKILNNLNSNAMKEYEIIDAIAAYLLLTLKDLEEIFPNHPKYTLLFTQDDFDFRAFFFHLFSKDQAKLTKYLIEKFIDNDEELSKRVEEYYRHF